MDLDPNGLSSLPLSVRIRLNVDVVGNYGYWVDHTVHLATFIWRQDGGVFLAMDVQCRWTDLDREPIPVYADAKGWC